MNNILQRNTKNNASVKAYVDNVSDENMRKDSKLLLALFKKITGEKPAMWGESIIGYGSYHYKSERSAQEGDWPLTGFAPRKQALSIYIMSGYQDQAILLEKLGKYKSSVSCLYIKKLSDIKIDVLEKIIKKSYLKMKKNYK